MAKLKPITSHDRFYQQVLALRRQLDQVLIEYEDSMPRQRYPKKLEPLVNPVTGKVHPIKENHNAKNNGRQRTNISGV